jgi:hypothetical protein
MENNQELTVSTAISVLIQGVEIAQKQGAYTLDDAELLSKAVKFFKNTAKKSTEVDTETPAQEPAPATPTPTGRGRKTSK